MARQDFGQFVDGLLREASTYFPRLAPIHLTRSHQHDAWRVQTRAGDFEFTEEFAPNRRHLVEFLSYQFQQLERAAEREEHRRATHLRVGDRITVGGREARIAHIADGVVTLEQDPREVGRCDCRECRDRQMQRQMHELDAMRYAMPPIAPAGWNQAPPQISREAEARSLELLRRNLTPEQTRQWDREQAIEVRGQSGTRYLIRGQIGAFNIDRIGGGRICCTPGGSGELPLGDYVLGQKLALEHDEARFLATANFANMDPERVQRARELARDLAREPGRPIVATTADLDRLFREAYMAIDHGMPGF